MIEVAKIHPSQAKATETTALINPPPVESADDALEKSLTRFPLNNPAIVPIIAIAKIGNIFIIVVET